MTVLSSYNPDNRCFLHAVPRFGSVTSLRRRTRMAEELEGKHAVLDDGPRCRMTDCNVVITARGLCDHHYRARIRVLRKLGRTG